MKLHDVGATVQTVGLAPRAALIVAAVATGLEVGVALALLVGLYRVAGVVVMGLGLSFAAGGLFALARGLDVPCTCFGGASTARLGWRQVIALPAWLLTASAMTGLPSTSFRTRIGVAIALAVLLAGLRAVSCAREYQAARLDRHAFAGGGS
ncbi:MAG: hypothetical protein M3Q31_16470 [Actinomycetota bacterium]|nr:hypothetical protein [Actinomycetota bacterium]